MKNLKDFYENKTVLITGHTGFKGSWLCHILLNLGAKIVGYALEPETEPSLFCLSFLDKKVISIISDIRDYEKLKKEFDTHKPEIVFHLAAQPIVRDSYKDPRYTYDTNVMGTVNVLECIRNTDCVKSFLNVTTDKVYKNKEWVWGYRENEELDGYDPYSNSKSLSELATWTYVRSFFEDRNVSVSTARAGNVIGGGDFSNDRIIPDCVRAVEKCEDIIVRNPYSIRPYQHVLEPLFAYLMIAEKQYDNKDYQGAYNVGPNETDCVTTGTLVNLFCKNWGNQARWKNISEKNAPHEAGFLKLDCSLIKSKFNWKPKWDVDEAIKKTCSWTKIWLENGDVANEMLNQINLYMEE
ncbi:MAG: CDP-glucose 4,6-dehydratase [Ruminococcaceae bacterium]|nr:CDP-glucose 4,6-dehydratase [Oscillospiraceae bacterium]